MGTGHLDQLWREKLHPAGRTQWTSGIGILDHLVMMMMFDNADDDGDANVQVYPAGHAWIHYALHQLTDAGWDSS